MASIVFPLFFFQYHYIHRYNNFHPCIQQCKQYMYARFSLHFKSKNFHLSNYLFRKQMHSENLLLQLLHSTSSVINCKSINNRGNPFPL